MSFGDPFIAGSKRVSDWRAFRQQLEDNPTPELWEAAHRDYLSARLETRYFKPLKTLRADDELAGEGFSIMVILCSLVEFLESTVRGLKYKYRGPCGQYEYDSSREVFMSFPLNRKPFSQSFTDPDTALEFYQSVRCGLMHEAQTKSGWRIWATSYRRVIIDKQQKIVYRDDFYEAILEFVRNYGKGLVQDAELQAAFIRKFNSLCD
jgi:hypothetical protein